MRCPPSFEWRELVTGLKVCFHHVTGLHPKVDYVFRVRSWNEYGCSEPSLPVSIYRPYSGRCQSQFCLIHHLKFYQNVDLVDDVNPYHCCDNCNSVHVYNISNQVLYICLQTTSKKASLWTIKFFIKALVSVLKTITH